MHTKTWWRLWPPWDGRRSTNESRRCGHSIDRWAIAKHTLIVSPVWQFRQLIYYEFNLRNTKCALSYNETSLQCINYTLSVEVIGSDSGLIDWKSMHCWVSRDNHREDEDVFVSRHSLFSVQLQHRIHVLNYINICTLIEANCVMRRRNNRLKDNLWFGHWIA